MGFCFFEIAPSTASKWTQRWREGGSVRLGDRPRLLEPYRTTAHALLAEQPHRSVKELQGELTARVIKVSQEAVRNFLHAEQLSFKKSAFAAEQDRPDVGRRRRR